MELNLRLTPEPELSHSEYFALCLSAHFATVATFVPTDVDNQIRSKLWASGLPAFEVSNMVDTVMAMHRWDCRAVSARWVSGEDGWVVSGHNGEWFSVAAAAYGALRSRDKDRAREVLEAIADELEKHAALYREKKRQRDGIGLLKVATVIAHNLGDLDRVIDMWELADEDPLRLLAYKAGHEGTNRFGGVLAEAGRLNKAFMAEENHRHFALRKPRALRGQADLLLPIGPLFDGWGETVARHPALSEEQKAEIAEALVDGWTWQRKQKPVEPGVRPAVGYARALSGMAESFPGGPGQLHRALPSRIAKEMRTGELHAASSVPRARFEESWSRMPFKFLAR
jgi:hypothetical protein